MSDYAAWLEDVVAKIPRIDRDPLEYALETSLPSEAVIAEFGVYCGRTIRRIATQFPQHDVFGFDSFCGLPERWRDGYDAGTFDMHGLPPSDLPSNVTLVKGLFEDTLPVFAQACGHRPLLFLHIDCDIYSSTATVFNALKDMFRDGTVIVFDEAFNYQGWQDHELKALYEFLSANPRWDVRWIGKQGTVLCDGENAFQQAVCKLTLKKPGSAELVG